MEKLEQFILDEGRKEKRERALGYDLPDEEHGEGEWEEMKLHTILTDPKKEKLFGELLRNNTVLVGDYGDDIEGLFGHLAQGTAGANELKILNRARYEFSRRWAVAEKLRAGLTDDDIEYLAQQNGDFDYLIAGVVKDNKRAASLVREHFYRMTMQGRLEDLEEIVQTQGKLKELRASENFRKSNDLAKELCERYGFSSEQWSQLEEGHYTDEERRAEINKMRQQFGLGRGWLDRFRFLTARKARKTAERTIAGDEAETRNVIRAQLEKNNNWWVRSKTRKIMRMIGEIEAGDPMQSIKEGYTSIGTILATSISRDTRLQAELIRESEGGDTATAIDSSRPLTLADLDQEKNNLNDTNFRNGFKTYLKRRTDEGLNLQGLGNDDRMRELEEYQKDMSAPKKGVFGFFADILKAFKAGWLTPEKKSAMLKDTTLWQI